MAGTPRMELLQVLNEAEKLAEQAITDWISSHPVGTGGWDKVTMFAELGALISRASDMVLRLQLQGDPVIVEHNPPTDPPRYADQ